MGVMDAVWPLTMLYWGPAGLIFYIELGRALRSNSGLPAHAEKPMWQATFSGATHCGAGCALGDFIGDWLAFLIGLRLFGSELAGKYVLAFTLAYIIGIVFQYFSVAPMRGLPLGRGLVTAVKIDTLSLAAYQAGMFAWMALDHHLFPGLKPTDWLYWFMMQIAMVVGFMTTYPINWWLIRRGIKEKM